VCGAKSRAARLAIGVGESYELIATELDKKPSAQGRRRDLPQSSGKVATLKDLGLLRCRALASSRCLAQHGGPRIAAGVAAGARARAGR
jgi:hypothetical protein